ncbi:MAG: hydrogenase maturation protease [Betaproteobacteria bacterium]|nr:hydrogenase maturation protease [Betaproteobacteria bacterium]
MSPLTTPPVVVFACGNLSRGDDALGPRLLERLEQWLETEGRQESFELIYDYQLQLEHALDLEGRALALFIDAGDKTQPPFRFYPAQPSVSVAHTSHALPPEAVLGVWCRISPERRPPPSFVLCVRGEHFGLGAMMSQEARTHEDAAFSFLQSLCRAPDPASWQALSTEHS